MCGNFWCTISTYSESTIRQVSRFDVYEIRMFHPELHTSHLISTHDLGRLLDEEMSAQERLDLEDAEAVCRRFLAWDLDAPNQDGIVKVRLERCIGRNTEADKIELGTD
jgi:hypothetical protein